MTFETKERKIQYYFEDTMTNRNQLFKEALTCAKNGRVLYILHEELNELPQLSQDLAAVNRHYMKMISFLYAKTLSSLIESISTLPDWKNIPCTIIIDTLDAYCPREKMQNACGVLALLVDTVRSCSRALKVQGNLVIAVNKDVGVHYCNILEELYPSLLIP